MAGAFLYLFLCSARNRVRVRLRRLQQPRYLIGSAAGVLYLYTFVFRHALNRGARVGITPMALLERASGAIEIAGAIALFVIAAAAWVLPGVGQPIEFSRSEVQFLFQAPLTRRQLLHYKLLRGQIGALFGTMVATVFLRPGSFAAGWTFLVGMWLLLATLRLHLIGVVLRRQSLTQHAGHAVRRQRVPLLVIGAAIVTLASVVIADWPILSGLERSTDVAREIGRLAESAPAVWILWPFRMLVRLPLSVTTAAFSRALPPVLVMIALNYFWALRGDVAFEEASAAYAERRANERSAPETGRRNTKVVPFRLALTGRPETAILWKNLIVLGRYASLRALRRFVPLVVILAVLASRSASAGIASSVGIICLFGAAMVTVIGPQTVRNDLRQDLASMATLKTWPIRGAALVRGELLAPAIVLTCLTWMLIMICVVFGQTHGYDRFSPPSVVIERAMPLAIAAALLAPALIVAQLVIQNGLAILFPAWVTIGSARARGIDAMGQRLLMMAGVVVAVVAALVPAAVVGAAAAFLLHRLDPQARSGLILLPALIVSAGVIGECWLAVEWLGRVFERTDVGALDGAE
jgi:hypothetical protein